MFRGKELKSIETESLIFKRQGNREEKIERRTHTHCRQTDTGTLTHTCTHSHSTKQHQHHQHKPQCSVWGIDSLPLTLILRVDNVVDINAQEKQNRQAKQSRQTKAKAAQRSYHASSPSSPSIHAIHSILNRVFVAHFHRNPQKKFIGFVWPDGGAAQLGIFFLTCPGRVGDVSAVASE